MGANLCSSCCGERDDDANSNNTTSPQTPSHQEPLLSNNHTADKGSPQRQQQQQTKQTKNAESDDINDRSDQQRASRGATVNTTTTTSTARSSVNPSAAAVGSATKSLQEYELLAFLGQGSFAEVTLARHKVTRELFAIKKISKRKVKDEGCIERTFTERQILSSLRHPFLVKLYQAFQSATHLYMVLEFAHGGDFRTYLNTHHNMLLQHAPMNSSFAQLRSPTSPPRGGPQRHADPMNPEKTFESTIPFSETATTPQSAAQDSSSTLTMPHLPPAQRKRLGLDQICFYAIEIALSLIFLHSKGFVYRDLKPENILMRRDGHVMLTDFGVAKRRAPLDRQRSTSSLLSAVRTSNVVHADSESNRGGNTIHHTFSADHDDDTNEKRQNSFVGTQRYMSPEMLQGHPHGGPTDWWSYGCCLFEIAADRHPFDYPNEYQLFQSIVEQPVGIKDGDFDPALFTWTTSGSAPDVSSQAQGKTVVDEGDASSSSSSSSGVARAVLLLQDLIVQLLQRDPRQRLVEDAVILHPFFQLKEWNVLFKVPITSVETYSSSSPRSDQQRRQADMLQAFLTRTATPPYVPRLRGNEDLRCFPFSLASDHLRRSGGGTGADVAVAARQRTRSADHKAVLPSDELFDFMISADVDHRDDHSINNDTDTTAPRASPPCHAHYYEDAALPADHVELGDVDAVQGLVESTSSTPPTRWRAGTAKPEGEGGERQDGLFVPSSLQSSSQRSSPNLLGVAYEVDDPHLEGSQHLLFDGYSVAQWRASRVGSLNSGMLASARSQVAYSPSEDGRRWEGHYQNYTYDARTDGIINSGALFDSASK